MGKVNEQDEKKEHEEQVKRCAIYKDCIERCNDDLLEMQEQICDVHYPFYPNAEETLRRITEWQTDWMRIVGNARSLLEASQQVIKDISRTSYLTIFRQAEGEIASLKKESHDLRIALNATENELREAKYKLKDERARRIHLKGELDKVKKEKK